MIPVQWWNLHEDVCHPRDHWDTAWLQAVFAGRVVPPRRRYDAFCEEAWGPDFGRVIMVAGRFHVGDVDALNRMLNGAAAADLPRALVIHSDEESLFPVGDLDVPPLTQLWVMTPRPDRTYPAGTRFLGEGWSPYTPEILSAWGGHQRTIDVGFTGQINHPRREAMRAAFPASGYIDGVQVNIHPTVGGFAHGMPRAAYLAQLADTRVALCPSGPATQDSFRVYEALEAGCVPIVDDVTPDGREGYWDLMLGPEAHPLSLVYDWAQAPAIARSILNNFEYHQIRCAAWWRAYQQRLVDQLRADVAAVRA